MRTVPKKIVFVIVSILCLAPVIYADWDQGDPYKMHFPQMPNPIGWDIDLRQFELADDWQCTQTGPVKDIHFWISWAEDYVGTINQIMVKIYDNNALPPSKPRNQLWGRTFTAGQFTIRGPYYGDQGYWIPNPTSPTIYWHDHMLYYQVNIKDINNPFTQQQGNIYWLSLKLPSSQYPYAGWKTSLDHFMDAATVKYGTSPGWQPLYEPNSTIPIDFSFVITGEPNEPPYPTAKWLQKPDLTTNGLDVAAMEPYPLLADDFECNKSTLITDITIWGSWKDDILPPGGANDVMFTLSIHSDMPTSQSPSGYSMPNEVLWLKTLRASEVTIQRQGINEGWWHPYYMEYLPIGDHVCWKYVFHIPEANAFCQKGEPNRPIVYWLDVMAHPNSISTAQFGWKTSYNHWNDDAVWTSSPEPYTGWWNRLIYPPGHPLEPNSIDLAFAIDGNIPCNMPENDLGDAPDSSNNFGVAMTAYPALGVIANYPTVYLMGSPPFGPIHWQPQGAAWLGQNVTLEVEADIGADQDPTNNIIPLTNTPDQDLADDGVSFPMAAMPQFCPARFNYSVNNVLNPNINLYVNVWFDWNRDGDWDDIIPCPYRPRTNAPEWAVQNKLLPAASLVIGPNPLTTPWFIACFPPNIQTQPVWMRITLSEQPWVSGGGYLGDGGSGPPAGYVYGETEDYFFEPIRQPTCWDLFHCPGQTRGDSTCDGKVNAADLLALKRSWLKAYGQLNYNCCANFNQTGSVNAADLLILKQNWLVIGLGGDGTQACPAPEP